MGKIKYIFTQRLAGYLMFKGFVLLKMTDDLKNPSKHIFIFNESEEIRKAIDDYSMIKNKE